MHELSVAEAIISAVIREKDDRNLSEIASVGVKVGALSGVLPDALQFSFETAVEGTSLAGTNLVMEPVSACGQCRDCSREFEIGDLIFSCPDCGSGQMAYEEGCMKCHVCGYSECG